jgi:hypothetical protein
LPPYSPQSNFDPDSFTWSKVEASGTLPKPRSGHTATLINGGTQLLVFGGCGANSDFLSDVHVLHLSNMHWDQPKCVVRISNTSPPTPPDLTRLREWRLNQDFGTHARKWEISCTFFLVQDPVIFSLVSLECFLKKGVCGNARE